MNGSSGKSGVLIFVLNSRKGRLNGMGVFSVNISVLIRVKIVPGFEKRVVTVKGYSSHGLVRIVILCVGNDRRRYSVVEKLSLR